LCKETRPQDDRSFRRALPRQLPFTDRLEHPGQWHPRQVQLPSHSASLSAHTKDGIIFFANAGYTANTIAGELAAVDLRGLIGVAILRFVQLR
jgi:hypothetical protein